MSILRFPADGLDILVVDSRSVEEQGILSLATKPIPLYSCLTLNSWIPWKPQ